MSTTSFTPLTGGFPKTQSNPADKTVLAAPGAGGAAITRECSTNLADWATAASGAHTILPAEEFFRIKLERIPAN